MAANVTRRETTRHHVPLLEVHTTPSEVILQNNKKSNLNQMALNAVYRKYREQKHSTTRQGCNQQTPESGKIYRKYD